MTTGFRAAAARAVEVASPSDQCDHLVISPTSDSALIVMDVAGETTVMASGCFPRGEYGHRLVPA